jgi:hypothetical protein
MGRLYVTNWKGCGRKRSWSIFRYYRINYLEGLRKTRKLSVSVACLRCRDSILGPRKGVSTAHSTTMIASQFKDRLDGLKESQNTYKILVGASGKCICKLNLEEIRCEHDKRPEIFQGIAFSVIYFNSIASTLVH